MTIYANINFKTKKALKEAVANGQKIGIREITPFGVEYPRSGTHAICGPWYPQAHKWYAEIEMIDGVIAKVK